MASRQIRVMIVDDDDVFRNHLKNLHDWNANGFAICAEASNGQEAMEMLEIHSPDIVLTDIQMPVVDGLSLIAYTAAKFPQIQIVALSGYDEYALVRGSLKHGALDYLLKHQITSSGLLETLNEIISRIDAEGGIETAGKEAFHKTEVSLLEKRRLFLSDLLSDNVSDKTNIEKLTGELEMNVRNGYFALIVAEIDQMSIYKSKYSDIEWMRLFGQIIDVVQQLVDTQGDTQDKVNLVLPQPESRFTILFCIPGWYSYMLLNNYIATHLQNIKTALKRHFNITACYSVNTQINDYHQLPSKYNCTLAALEKSHHLGKNMVFYEQTQPLDAPEHDAVYFRTDDEVQISSLLHDGCIDELERYIDELFSRQLIANIEPERLQMMFVELLSVLSRAARQKGIDPYELFPQNDIYAQIRYMTVDEMKEFFIDSCRTLTDRCAPASDKGMSELTRSACAYINSSYRQPISLSDVAKAVCVSPSYLSRVFKADTGSTAVEYINSIRINAAKKMIDEGVQMKGLAKRVGFNSDNYFAMVFHQITGSTPVQYKKKREANL